MLCLTLALLTMKIGYLHALYRVYIDVNIVHTTFCW